MTENPTDFDANPFGEGPEMLGEPPATPPTDEELREWEQRWNAQSVEGQRVRALIQEVRRLREQVRVERTNMLFAQDHGREQGERTEKAEAERDRYRRAILDALVQLKPGHVARAQVTLRAPLAAQDLLNQKDS